MKHKNMLLIAFFLTLFVFQEVQAGVTTPPAVNPSKNSAPANGYLDHVWLYILRLNPDGSKVIPDAMCQTDDPGDGCAEYGYYFPDMNNPI